MSDDTPTTPLDTPATPAPRRRRAAGRPAGPPAEAATAPQATTEPEVTEAPAKKATRKAPTKSAKKAPAKAAAAPEAPEAPAKKATKAPASRSRKKAAAAVEPTASVELAAGSDSSHVPTEGTAAPSTEPAPKRSRGRKIAPPAFSAVEDPEAPAAPEASAAGLLMFQAPSTEAAPVRRTRKKAAPAAPVAETPVEDEVEVDEEELDESAAAGIDDTAVEGDGASAEDDGEESGSSRRRRRRGGRGRRRRTGAASDADEAASDEEPDEDETEGEPEGDADDDSSSASSRRRRRRRRRGGGEEGSENDDPPNTVVRVREPRSRNSEVTSVKGSTRLEAKKQRRREGREAGRRRPSILTEAEFLARREAVDRVMIVRQRDDRTQIAVLEDGVLVEHYVNRSTGGSMIGNVYLGRVQNVLPSMEAAFVDVGRGRNAVLYAGEVNWDAAGLEGQPKRIESALKSGDPVLVQVSKDPLGHKGARLTAQISLPGRFLVYVPEGSMTGISRKLPDTERSRLKSILRQIVPEDAGVIVRTAAEGASEEELRRDVERLTAQWEEIKAKAESASGGPALLHGEPDLAIKVVRDIFNEDFGRLVVEGDAAWTEIEGYVTGVAPDLAERVTKWVGPGDMFSDYRIDEQLAKALDRKVWLPSGGSLVIDRTEAMTVVDVNTGKFTGQGGNLEETVTKNNLEAAEEIVRQLRLRDVGGIVVIDFIDMVLENNRDLVLRRLLECLGRDRTKHQVAEVTSLGLVQMTRKRIGQGLLEVFSESCETCQGRGYHVHSEPVVAKSTPAESDAPTSATKRKRKGADSEGEGRGRRSRAVVETEPAAEPRVIDPAVSVAMEKIHAAAAKRAEDERLAAESGSSPSADGDGDAEADTTPTAPEASSEAPAAVVEVEETPEEITQVVAEAPKAPARRTRRKATRQAGPAAPVEGGA